MKNECGVEILLVEDNPSDEELAIRALTKHNLSNKIFVARDGAEALEYIFAAGQCSGKDTNCCPKVILLDLKLPKVDRLEVLRRIKSDPKTKHIPAVVLTSSREESDLVESYNLGANSFIVKSVDFKQFTESIRQIGMY